MSAIMKHKLLVTTLAFFFFFLNTLHVFCQWVWTNGPGGGSVTALIESGTDIFASSYGGVFLSSNNGGNWQPANGGLENRKVAVFAVVGSRVIAGTDSGLFRYNSFTN